MADIASDLATIETPTIAADEEWQARVDLAALHRLAALEDWDDLLFTHMSARIPGDDAHFLISPLGLMFDEVTASSLLKVDFAGNVVDPSPWRLSHGAFVIHAAVHLARADAEYVVHLHTDDGIAVSCQSHGLLPLNQRSLGVIDRLAYQDYEGLAQEIGGQDPLIAALGDKNLIIMRNHGTLSLGISAAHAWLGMHSLEKACTAQVRALSAGIGNLALPSQASIDRLASQLSQITKVDRANERESYSDVPVLAWAALTRKLDRVSPGYAN